MLGICFNCNEKYQLTEDLIQKHTENQSEKIDVYFTKI